MGKNIFAIICGLGLVIFSFAGCIKSDTKLSQALDSQKFQNIAVSNDVTSKAEDSISKEFEGETNIGQASSNKANTGEGDKRTSNTNDSGGKNDALPGNSADSGSNNNDRIAYLTFDDAPSENTIKILDTLKAYGIKATFFPNVDEENIEFTRQMFKRMAKEGHAIGNHTYSHNYSRVYSSIDNYIQDTNKLNDFIFDATGLKPDIIRFPGGSNNRVSLKYGGKEFMGKLIPKIKGLGYQYFDWNVSSADSAADTVPKDRIVENILKGAESKKNVIILMHQTRLKTTSAEALPEVIEGLKAMGFRFDKLTSSSHPFQFKK